MLEEATDNKLPSIDENAELEEQVIIFSNIFDPNTVYSLNDFYPSHRSIAFNKSFPATV